MNEDIRWKQRFQNYKKALLTIKKAVDLANTRELSDLEKQGLIQGFEFTFELAWNVMKDYLEEQGITDIIGSKNAIRHAFSNDLIKNGETWMEMVNARNISSHTYDEETAERLFIQIKEDFNILFINFEKKMESI
ncbi:MAG: nucleotidyltransferase substrate binding protein [Treponema sp.]|nr:nucleotidyltransferase substrate binding protein [Treponema sp.]